MLLTCRYRTKLLIGSFCLVGTIVKRFENGNEIICCPEDGKLWRNSDRMFNVASKNCRKDSRDQRALKIGTELVLIVQSKLVSVERLSAIFSLTIYIKLTNFLIFKENLILLDHFECLKRLRMGSSCSDATKLKVNNKLLYSVIVM